MHIKVCPGRYCGRVVQGNTTEDLGECGVSLVINMYNNVNLGLSIELISC